MKPASGLQVNTGKPASCSAGLPTAARSLCCPALLSRSVARPARCSTGRRGGTSRSARSWLRHATLGAVPRHEAFLSWPAAAVPCAVCRCHPICLFSSSWRLDLCSDWLPWCAWKCWIFIRCDDMAVVAPWATQNVDKMAYTRVLHASNIISDRC